MTSKDSRKPASFAHKITMAGIFSMSFCIATEAAPDRANIREPAPQPLTIIMLDRIEARIGDQFDETAHDLKQGGDPWLEKQHLDASHGQNDPWNDVLQISRLDNPLVSEACRERALEKALENADDRTAVRNHLREKAENWDLVRQGTMSMHLSDFYDHMASCKKACGPYMAGVLRCHIENIRNYPRAIIYFGVGRPRHREVDSFIFAREDQKKVETFAQRALGEGKDILLLSRASILSTSDQQNISGNRHVAELRAEAVQTLLVNSNFPPRRIKKKILAWEPPRLVVSDIAKAYGFTDDWYNKGNKQFMDQSVIIVAY